MLIVAAEGALWRLWGGRRNSLGALRRLADELHDGPHGHSGKNKPQAHLTIGFHGSLAMVMLNHRKSQADVSVEAARTDELVGIYDRSINVIEHDRQSWFRGRCCHSDLPVCEVRLAACAKKETAAIYEL